MSIRYYLLLVAGFITTCVFVVTFFLDNILLSNSLQKVRAEGIEVTKEMYEKRREYLEDFIQGTLSDHLAQINALLEAVSKFQPLAQWFASSTEHEEKGTWSNAASLMQQDEWIQFLQNTTDKKLLSALVPSKGPFFPMRAEPVKEGVAWVYLEGFLGHPDPFLGIEVPIRILDAESESASAFLTSGIIPTVYVLYDWNRFKMLDFAEEVEETALLQVPLIAGVEIDGNLFLQYLTEACSLAKKGDVIIPPPAACDFLITHPKPFEKDSFADSMQKSLLDREKYASELFLICQAAILQEIGFFSPNGAEKHWPDAMAFSSGSADNQTFFLKSVMDFSKPLFDDDAFFSSMTKEKHSPVSPGCCVVKSPHPNQAFLVNTAAIYWGEEKEKKRSLLSIGIDLRRMLKDIVASTHHYGFIASGGSVLINLSPEPHPHIVSKLIESALPQILDQKSGGFTLGGGKYYFVRVQPNADLDLHFVFFSPEQEEFGLLYDLQRHISSILKTVTIERKLLEALSIVVLWILLLDISKKITRPIVALSSSLKHVKKGEWDLIKFPFIRFSKNNEIKQLCDSFHDMVNGLKEKEKVTGILSKVVSEEIAREILKGDVKLGGEERIVTMLFADIRGFTRLTQNMPPHEVIEFLNKCMTKVSFAIEENKGVIDKYLGDGVMALYGAPIAHEDSPLHAILSGLEISRSLKQWNLERVRENLEPIHVGIGIHTGSVFAGNMGAQNRLNYTVIGSSVNRASRLCACAGPEEVLITKDTYLQPSVRENILVEDKGMMTLKGFDEKIQVFKVTGLSRSS
jgi:class 3 adenylate cyclase